MKNKKLVIISHTEHYWDSKNQIVGWGSTVNEINFLSNYWDEIVHVGCFYKQNAPKNTLNYSNSNIKFVPISPYGGKKIIDKLLILFKIPKIIFTVIKSVKNASEVQLRLPTSMGLFLLPLFSFFLPRKYTFWVKYAGDWSLQGAPLSYKIQRWWLQKNFAKCKVTINGFWENQPKHCLSFENPCLTENDLETGKNTIETKDFSNLFNLVFVGRLDENKGIDTILNALKNIDISKISQIDFIGESDSFDFYKKEFAFLKEKVKFHGFLNSDEVFTVLKKAHFLLLPSKSEGFPKVIAEAACFGVIPIVSNVGSISHYINENNGFVWQMNSLKLYENVFENALQSNPNELKNLSNSISILAQKFTFSSYYINLNNFIKP